MNGAITELSAKIIRSAKISNRKIMGPSQYLFLKRINCQNSLKMEKREKKLMLSSFFYVILSPTGEESAFLSFWMLRFAQHDTTLPLVILSSAKGGMKNLVFFSFRFFALLRMTIFVTRHSEPNGRRIPIFPSSNHPT